MTPTETHPTLDEIEDARKIKDQAQNDYEGAEADFRNAIRAALRHGVSVRLIADAAGVSQARIYQIRDGRR